MLQVLVFMLLSGDSFGNARNSITFRLESFNPAKLGAMIRTYMKNVDIFQSLSQSRSKCNPCRKKVGLGRNNIVWSFHRLI